MVTIYHKHFTQREIKDLLVFYQTDLGKKTIRVMPALVREGMEMGQQWGQALGPVIEQKVTERFKKHGIQISA